MEEHIEHLVQANPQILEDLRSKGVYCPSEEPVYGASYAKPLKTKSGKIEIYSEKYAEKGLDPRITSYNVCYTKLLRARLLLLKGFFSASL